MSATLSVDVSALADGLGARLRDIALAAERYGAFVFAPGDGQDSRGHDAGAAATTGEDRAGLARELVLRALRTAGDGYNDRLLRLLAGGDASLAELAGAVGLARLAVWERVNDLVQSGLVARSLEGDLAGLTAAGSTLLRLVDDVAHFCEQRIA